MRSARKLAAAMAVLGLVAAGCGDDDDTGPVAADDTTTSTTAATASEPDATEEGGPATVAVADGELGPILVDGDGRTLYLFTRDSADTSACTGGCLTNWPPLAAPDELVAGPGVDEAELGAITRDDGSRQVTYDSKPLYHFAGDEGPGDTNGQGVNDVWWVLGADGEAVMSAPAAGVSGY